MAKAAKPLPAAAGGCSAASCSLHRSSPPTPPGRDGVLVPRGERLSFWGGGGAFSGFGGIPLWVFAGRVLARGDKEETGSWVAPVRQGTLSQNNDVGGGSRLGHGAADGVGGVSAELPNLPPAGAVGVRSRSPLEPPWDQPTWVKFIAALQTLLPRGGGGHRRGSSLRMQERNR